MLLRAVIHNTDAHFFPVRGRKQLDGAAVEGRTDPFFRIQADTDLLLFHEITSL